MMAKSTIGNSRAVFHFELALEGRTIEIELAGSKRYTLDLIEPSEETISEMISFILLKLASSIFGL